MFTRTRFQAGSLTKEKRQRQADVWIYRWRETDQDGKLRRRKVIIGTVDEYRTESLAKKALAALNLNINSNPSDGSHPALITMGQLVEHYTEHELGERRLSKAQSTVDVYKEFLAYWIVPHWKQVRAAAVKPTDVEEWLHSLSLADGTKAKIRNIMSAVLQHGLRHQLIAINPIRGLVRQSAKRQKDPDILTVEEIRTMMQRLSPLHRTMVFVASATGLRFSEIRGLQWQDVNFGLGTINLKRGVVRKHVSALKTRASRKPVPLHPALVQELREARSRTAYNQPTDWVFASVRAKGKVPVWPSSLMEDHILPAAKQAGVTKHVSWHVFRHSFASLLKANGEDVKVVQDLLRHSTFQISMDIYAQAVPQALRAAHLRVAEQLMSSDDNSTPKPFGPALDPSSSEVAVSC